jgi:hypothetical protein
MVTLRCTQKLLKRMRLTVEDLKGTVPAEPTTALGDWYAHLLIIDRQHLVMFVNARSRLCVLTYARDIDRLTKRFRDALTEVLQELQIPEEAIQRELNAMSELCYGLTTGTSDGRSVLGSIIDFTKPLQYSGLEDRSLPEWNLHFTRWICGPLGNKRPGEMARQLLDPPSRSDGEGGES